MNAAFANGRKDVPTVNTPIKTGTQKDVLPIIIKDGDPMAQGVLGVVRPDAASPAPTLISARCRATVSWALRPLSAFGEHPFRACQALGLHISVVDGVKAETLDSSQIALA
ncbi:hypothetical protein AB0F17_25370 [Nonomuraea sp. NPDC026600]|uniref:hypothetical protein n=1 Tax=Nonomuraea sp. NPDC026600 TaxID=3155363 RepID=UPI0033FB41BC